MVDALHTTSVVAAGRITDDWAAEFVSEPDGWRFELWLSGLFIGDDAPTPAVAPEHLAMRFVSFGEALAFFRQHYGGRDRVDTFNDRSKGAG